MVVTAAVVDCCGIYCCRRPSAGITGLGVVVVVFCSLWVLPAVAAAE